MDLEFKKAVEEGCLRVEDIKSSSGDLLGRAAVFSPFREPSTPGDPSAKCRGVITTGGIRSGELGGLLGVLRGSVVTAARNLALPLANLTDLTSWAGDQAEKIHGSNVDIVSKYKSAMVIANLGGSLGQLPIGKHRGKWISLSYFENDPIPQKFTFIDAGFLEFDPTFDDHSFVQNDWIYTQTGHKFAIIHGTLDHKIVAWPHEASLVPQYSDRVFGQILTAVAKVWDLTPEETYATILDPHQWINIEQLSGSPVGYPCVTISKVAKPT